MTDELGLTVYLAGEIHSDWRTEVMDSVRAMDLPVTFVAPVTDHPASDSVGVDVLGDEEFLAAINLHQHGQDVTKPPAT